MNLCYIRNRIFEGFDVRCPRLQPPRDVAVSQRRTGGNITGEPASSTAVAAVRAREPHQPHIHHRLDSGLCSPSPPPSNLLSPTSTSSNTLPPTLSVAHSPSVDRPPTTILTAASADAANMANSSDLNDLIKQLHQALSSRNPSNGPSLLSRAKLALLHLNALIPTPKTPQQHLVAAREVLELGAMLSIRLQDPDGFTRYFQQLQPFYALPANVLSKEKSNSSKITGLYLLLLLSQGDYAGFHTLLETLEVAAQEARERDGAQGGKGGLEDDEFIQYPIRLEQALMEGSYDRVWGETKRERVPSPEFGVFSAVRICAIHMLPFLSQHSCYACRSIIYEHTQCTIPN